MLLLGVLDAAKSRRECRNLALSDFMHSTRAEPSDHRNVSSRAKKKKNENLHFFRRSAAEGRSEDELELVRDDPKIARDQFIRP